MERSPEALRAFYLIAINKGSTSTLDNGTIRNSLDVHDATVLKESPGVLSDKSSHPQTPSNPPETGLDICSIVDEIDISSHRNGGDGLPRKTFLQIVQQASKNSACRQCLLYQFHCDRQKPSCFKCERYSLPCYYEDDGDFLLDSNSPSPEFVPIPWEESAKSNPYHQLGGRQKLHRISLPLVGARRGRLSKPIPMRKKSSIRLDNSENENEEGHMLLRPLSPVDSDIETVSICSSPVSSMHTASRPVSPISLNDHSALAITSRPASEPAKILRVVSPITIESRPATHIDSETREPHGIFRAGQSEATEISPVSPPSLPTQQPDFQSVLSLSRPISCRSTASSVSNVSSRSPRTESSPRRSLSILTCPSTVEASSSWLPPLLESTWNDVSKSFQCTFCLQNCSSQDEWERHEVLHHIQQKIWICMPNGPVERSNHYNVCVFCGVVDPNRRHGLHHGVEECGYENWHKDRTFINKDALQRHLSTIHHQSEMTPRMHRWFHHPRDDEWYWNCGFCDIILPSWTKRVEHIATHFNEGAAMSYWDPLLPPYPLDRTTMSCAAWFPTLNWDAGTLWDLRTKRSGWSWVHSLEDQYLCKHCDINVYFRSEEDAKRHEHIWHSRREIWSCPTIEDIAAGSLARFFFPGKSPSNWLDDSSCPFCSRHFLDIANSDPETDNIWEIRVRHLQFDHNFDCESLCNFASADHLLLHLANVHKLCLIGSTTSKVLESCRRDHLELAEKMTEQTVIVS